MSQQGMLIGEDARNPGREDAMSTSGESVNPLLVRQPSGEGLGGGLQPQEMGLPAPSHQWLVVAGEGPRVADSIPDERALIRPLEGPRVADSGIGQELANLVPQGLRVTDSG